jgi:hypothetical protein
MLTGAHLAALSGALGAVLLADWAMCQPLKPVLGCGWSFPACALWPVSASTGVRECVAAAVGPFGQPGELV